MTNSNKPLADNMRPISLDEYLGQDEIVGDNKLLRLAIESDNLPSMIFWGPPGSGKTTLASIIAKHTKAKFLSISAVANGMKELRSIILEAKTNEIEDKKTVLFIDEIHRWNKTQQDALLPHVENGTLILIGATTENPSFEVRSALMSRCRVFVLKKLTNNAIEIIIKKALKDEVRGLGKLNIDIEDEVIGLLAYLSKGDARTALNILEYTSSIGSKITKEVVKDAIQKSHILYDKKGEEHFNIISALHKSMRGSDANAAIYWLTRMLQGGEDPLYIARRLVRFASEDIGLANSKALEQATAGFQACHFIGMPECGVILAQVVVYLSKCKKSNDLYVAYERATKDVKEYGNLSVPLHIRNAPTSLMKDMGYGKGYKYSPDHGYKEDQTYLPNELNEKKYINN